MGNTSMSALCCRKVWVDMHVRMVMWQDFCRELIPNGRRESSEYQARLLLSACNLYSIASVEQTWQEEVFEPCPCTRSA